MITAHLEASNKADWIIQVTATDQETGVALDFTGASIDFKLRDQSGCQRLEASTSLGNITLPDTGVIEIQFTPAQMCGLCPGTYQIGCVYNLNDETTQLFVGDVAIYDGVARL